MMTEPLHIPLVLDRIATHLGRRHLFKAMLVCRTWYTVFRPLAWNTYTFSRHDAEALARHGHLVEHLTAYKPNEQEIDLITASCPSLLDLKLELIALQLGALENFVPRLSRLRTVDLVQMAANMDQLLLAPLTQPARLEHFSFKGLYHFMSSSPVSQIHTNMLLRILNASAATLQSIKLEDIQPCFHPIQPKMPEAKTSDGGRSWWDWRTTRPSHEKKSNQQLDKWRIIVPIQSPDPSKPPRLVDSDTYWKEVAIMRKKEPWRSFIPSDSPQYTEEGLAEIERVTAPLGDDVPCWSRLESIQLFGIREHAQEGVRFLQSLIRHAPNLTRLTLSHSIVDLHGLDGRDCPNLRSLQVAGIGPLTDSLKGVFDFLLRAPSALRELHFCRQPVTYEQMMLIPVSIRNQLTALTVPISTGFTHSQLWETLAQGFPALTWLFIEDGRWPTWDAYTRDPWLCAPHLRYFGLGDVYFGTIPADPASFPSLWTDMCHLKHLCLGLDQLRYFHLWLAEKDAERPLALVSDSYDLSEDNTSRTNSIQGSKPCLFREVECLELWFVRSPPLMLQEIKHIVGALPRLTTIRYRANTPFTSAAKQWLSQGRPDIDLTFAGSIFKLIQ